MGIGPFAQTFGDFLKAQAVDGKLASAPQSGGGEQWIPSPFLTHVASPFVDFLFNWFSDSSIHSLIV